MEERGQTPDEPRNLYRLFHPLWIQQRSFDEVHKCIEVPFRMVLGQHDLRKCWSARSVGILITHLGFQ